MHLSQEQILDYSHITSQIRPKIERRSSTLTTGPSPESNVRLVRLDRLAEEVVESVLAGWSYRNRSEAHFAAWNSASPSSSRKPTTPEPHAPVQVLLDITPGNWAFRTHPGAFRRIVMNLLGNSLKFTDSGFIRVSLRQERTRDQITGHSRSRSHIPAQSVPAQSTNKTRTQSLPDIFPSNTNDNTHTLAANPTPTPPDHHHRHHHRHHHHNHVPLSTITLTVTDSGRGISPSYLADQLFVPFSQEDPFAPGTGLGLCLVRQMALTLDGTINMASKLGSGTTVMVAVPLSRDIRAGVGTGTVVEDEEDGVFQQNLECLKGKRVMLVGLDEMMVGGPDRQGKGVGRLMRDVCREWFGMQVVNFGDGGEEGDNEEGEDGDNEEEEEEGEGDMSKRKMELHPEGRSGGETNRQQKRRVDFAICNYGGLETLANARVDCPGVYVKQDASRHDYVPGNRSGAAVHLLSRFIALSHP